MHSDQTDEITTVEWVSRHIRNYPDSDEKRRVQNLAEKLDMARHGMIYRINEAGDFTEEFMKRQEQVFELWWEFDTAMGRLKTTFAREAVESRRWIASYVVSVLALVIAIISLIVAIAS